MVTTVLVVLMILALLEIVLLNGARLFFMIVSAIQTAQDDKYTPHPHPKKEHRLKHPCFSHYQARCRPHRAFFMPF